MPFRRLQVLALAGAILTTLGLSGLAPRSVQAGPGAETEADEEAVDDEPQAAVDEDQTELERS